MEKKELQKSLIHLMRRYDRLFKKNISLRVDQTGVYRSQHQMLMFLGRHPAATQTEIADKMEISTAAVAVTLKKLKKGGYIETESDSVDARYNRISITPKGRQVIDFSRQQFEAIETDLFEDFSVEELEKIVHVMERLENRLEQMEEEQKKVKEEENR